MAHHNPKILEMVLDGTESEPVLRIRFVDGTELTYDAKSLQRFASDLVDWSFLMNDLRKEGGRA